MPAAGPYWTPWDLANLQQQQQGLQPLADYGQAQLAVALADRQRQQRMEDQARQIFLTFGRQAALAREAERARAKEAAAERTFRASESKLEHTSREKIAGEAAQRYADLFRHQDEAANRKSAEARMQYLRKLGYKPKDGEDIDEFEARALKEEQDKDDAEVDAMRGHYDQTKSDLLDVTRKLEADRQKSFSDAGELAVKTQGGLSGPQVTEMEKKGFKNFLSTLKPVKAAELRSIYAGAVDAQEQRYKPPIDLRDKEVFLRKDMDTMERVVLPGLLRTKRDTTRFYQGGDNPPGSPARPTYNSTVQSFLGDKGLIGGGGGTATGAAGAGGAVAAPAPLISPEGTFNQGILPYIAGQAQDVATYPFRKASEAVSPYYQAAKNDLGLLFHGGQFKTPSDFRPQDPNAPEPLPPDVGFTFRAPWVQSPDAPDAARAFISPPPAPIPTTQTPSVFPYNPYIPLMPYR